MDYTSLTGDKNTQDSIMSWVNYGKIPAAAIVAQAESYIYSRLRVREMRTSAQVAITLSVAYTALPSDLLDPVLLMMRDPQGEIQLVGEAQLLRDRTWDDSSTLTDGTPCSYAIFDERMNWDYLPDDTYVADLLYYKQPAALSASNLTNFLTNRYPLILRAACTALAFQFAKDNDGFTTNLKLADALIDEAKVQDDLTRRGLTHR